ncbi:hypothetical protein HYH03_018935 [Edaphochlamys debaryana]|uniref:MYND-type domain-containing protein n=1 Tax=Edaphochlamys debaryana TaxID=47281 RepID=A0A836BMG3_9CHLO|nr:hypothetical protein HYH03_018935 [Edaphochlamys debaryana]|eukprot:KAG2482111.1 hypothetical protein HYH03_018935 [Edaphochlamys debaryana]
MAAQQAQTLMSREAVQEVRNFIARDEAVHQAGAEELAAALRASTVAEHTWVALASVLRLWALEHTAAAGPSTESDCLGLLPRDVDMAVGEVTKILRSISTFHLRTLPAALESAAVLGPCASYTVLAHGIAVLSAMDGGGTHGLEPSVARGVSALVRKEAGEEAGRALGSGRDGAGHLPHLVMRVARLGVQAAAEAEAGRPREEAFTAMTALMLGTGPCRVMLRWRDATVLAADALASATSLMGPGAGPRASGDLGEEWWRLAVAVAPRLREPNPRFARGYVQHLLCQLPTVALPPAPLPPAPPAGLESALAGGVLPCLERLFRRTAASLCEGGPPPPEVEASTALSELDGGLWTRLAPVLAWGDARQAAALVRTIGKGLEATYPASGPDDRFQPNALTAITCRFLAEGRSWLESLVADGSRRGLGGGGAGALSPAERQLLEMLAAAAAAWLPPLCRLLWAELGRRTVRPEGTRRRRRRLEALAAQLVRWAHGSGPRGGRGGARASAAAGAQALAARFGAWFPSLEAAAALLPASPAAARAYLGGCSNPACANLEGDSDAALPLRACAGCGGAASYCSRECQTAH